ncbi:hypothetical protein PM082_008533 [Marasmius tenuissimus]|nr:hypothetical protein PM082_008533 [Marasmius tenuissimus]
MKKMPTLGKLGWKTSIFGELLITAPGDSIQHHARRGGKIEKSPIDNTLRPEDAENGLTSYHAIRQQRLVVDNLSLHHTSESKITQRKSLILETLRNRRDQD